MAVSKRLRYEVMRRDNNTCRYCGRSAPEVRLTIDHVIPVTLGGTDDSSNLVSACADCNAGKTSSNPDAALVAEVSDDAVRWARAMQASTAAALADLERRTARRQEFHGHWNSWALQSGRPLPTPTGWETTVDQLLAAGLPMPLLLESIDVAMRATRVKDTFRYMCGVAWKKVQTIAADARVVVGVSGSDEEEDTEFPMFDLADTYLRDMLEALGFSPRVRSIASAGLVDTLSDANKAWELGNILNPDLESEDDEPRSRFEAATEQAGYTSMYYCYAAGRVASGMEP